MLYQVMRSGNLRVSATLALILLFGVIAGCSRIPNTIDSTRQTAFGEVTRHGIFNQQGRTTQIASGPSTVFVANGFASEPSDEDRRVGYSILRLYNPSIRSNTLHIRLYFDNKPPVDIDPLSLEAQSNKYLFYLPQHWAEHFTGAKAWGARFHSDHPVIVDHWLLAGILPPGVDRLQDDARYKGGSSNTLARPHADRIWHFGDGLRLQFSRATEEIPYNEFDWYHVLNPGPENASVAMHWYYQDGDYDAYTFDVPAERVRIVSNLELARPNWAYGIKFVSDVPVVVQSERFVHDNAGMTDWGAWLHASRPGVSNAELHAWASVPAATDHE